jgi:hypothetical protein
VCLTRKRSSERALATVGPTALPCDGQRALRLLWLWLQVRWPVQVQRQPTILLRFRLARGLPQQWKNVCLLGGVGGRMLKSVHGTFLATSSLEFSSNAIKILTGWSSNAIKILKLVTWVGAEQQHSATFRNIPQQLLWRTRSVASRIWSLVRLSRSWSVWPPAHARREGHTPPHAPAHTRTHPHTPAHARTQTHTAAHARTHTHTPAHPHAHTRTPAHTRTHPQRHVSRTTASE